MVTLFSISQLIFYHIHVEINIINLGYLKQQKLTTDTCFKVNFILHFTLCILSYKINIKKFRLFELTLYCKGNSRFEILFSEVKSSGFKVKTSVTPLLHILTLHYYLYTT